MKKLVILSSSLVFALNSCSTEDSLNEGVPFIEEKQISVVAEDLSSVNGTRTAYTGTEYGYSFAWTEDDALGIFPESGYQTAFSISDGKGVGTNTAVFDGGDWALKANKSYAAYYPLIHNFDLVSTAIPVTYTGQIQDGNGATGHLSTYDYMASPFTEVDAKGNVNFKLQHLGCLVKFNLIMPGADTYSTLELTSNKTLFVTSGKYSLSDNIHTFTNTQKSNSIQIGLNNVATTDENNVLTIAAMFAPVNLSDSKLTLTVKGNKKDYSFDIDGAHFEQGKSYLFSGSFLVSGAVDFGLPSGLLWATQNIGAIVPEEIGNSYRWGQTSAVESTSFGNYDANYSVDYYPTNNNYRIFLDPEDDAATVALGNGWRMPTTLDFEELISETNPTWETLNNVPGMRFTSKTDPTKSIFMPASDQFAGISGLVGCYLAKDISIPESFVETINFLYFWESGCIIWNNYDRSANLPIRPVYGEMNVTPVSSISLVDANRLASNDRHILCLETNDSYNLLFLKSVVLPTDATNPIVSWEVSDANKLSLVKKTHNTANFVAREPGSVSITASAVDGSNRSATYDVFITQYEMVDLVLPSGLLWAKYNLGASAENLIGNRYAWGETSPKASYTEANYSGEPFRDAATVNMGAPWRLPTIADFKEIQENCIWTWTDSYNDTGVAGYIVQSKKYPYSRWANIFFPVGGHDSFFSVLNKTEGVYWSSNREPTPIYHDNSCNGLIFDKDAISELMEVKYEGLLIRPVIK